MDNQYINTELFYILFFFFGTVSLKSSVYFTLTAHLSSATFQMAQ